MYTDLQVADTNGNFNFNLWNKFDRSGAGSNRV